MIVLSPTTEALMKAVISAPPTDLACAACCEFNHFFAIHVQLHSVHLIEQHLTQPCMLLIIIVDFDCQLLGLSAVCSTACAVCKT